MYSGDSFSVVRRERNIREVSVAFDVVIRSAISLIVPLETDKKNLVFVKQYRASVDDFVLEFPAGRIEQEESQLEAAVRELAEESGFVATKIQSLGTFLTAPHISDETVHVFLAYGSVGLPLDPTDHEELCVISTPLSDVPYLVESGRLRDAKSIVAWTLAKPRLERGTD